MVQDTKTKSCGTSRGMILTIMDKAKIHLILVFEMFCDWKIKGDKKNNQMNYNLKVIIKNMAGYKDVRLDRSVYNIGVGCLVFM